MSKPKIGLSMLYCLGQPFTKMVQQLATVKTPYIEVVDDGLHTLSKKRVSMLSEAAESKGIEYTVHAPFADINVASPSKPMLNAVLRRLEKSIGYARDLNAFAWVFHPGLKTGVSMFYPGMDWLQNLETVRRLSRIARDCGVKIAIENVPEPFPFLMKSVEDFALFYSEVDAEVGLALDVGHANLNGQTEAFLRDFPGRIAHMHVSDNDGKSDQHLGIGYGTVDWKRFAALVKDISYDKAIVVESVEHAEQSVAALEKLLV